MATVLGLEEGDEGEELTFVILNVHHVRTHKRNGKTRNFLKDAVHFDAYSLMNIIIYHTWDEAVCPRQGKGVFNYIKKEKKARAPAQ